MRVDRKKIIRVLGHSNIKSSKKKKREREKTDIENDWKQYASESGAKLKEEMSWKCQVLLLGQEKWKLIFDLSI